MSLYLKEGLGTPQILKYTVLPQPRLHLEVALSELGQSLSNARLKVVCCHSDRIEWIVSAYRLRWRKPRPWNGHKAAYQPQELLRSSLAECKDGGLVPLHQAAPLSNHRFSQSQTFCLVFVRIKLPSRFYLTQGRFVIGAAQSLRTVCRPTIIFFH